MGQMFNTRFKFNCLLLSLLLVCISFLYSPKLLLLCRVLSTVSRTSAVADEVEAVGDRQALCLAYQG